MFCLERLVLFVSFFASIPQSSLLYTPFERAIHDLEFARILLVLHLYLLSLIVLLIALHLYLLSLIVLLIALHLYLLSMIIFALVLHLDILEHGGGFFKETIDLSCFT